MYTELYRYLIAHNNLVLPGIGTLSLNKEPAEGDFVHRQILPALYSFSLQNKTEGPSTHFFNWLSNVLSVSISEANIRFNEFIATLKKQMNEGAIITWNKVGTLKMGLGGIINFNPADASSYEVPVTAEKVLRENAEHKIRVGEEVKTSVEMEGILNPLVSKKSYWWITPLILIVFAITFITWYFVSHGFDVATLSNTSPLHPTETNVVQ